MLSGLMMLALTGVLATAGLVAFPSVGAAAPDQNTFSTANGVWNSRNPGHSWSTSAWNGNRGWQQRRDRVDPRRFGGARNNGFTTWNSGGWNSGGWNRGGWNRGGWNTWNGGSWNNWNNGRRYILQRGRGRR
jgi:hypothetical protein